MNYLVFSPPGLYDMDKNEKFLDFKTSVKEDWKSQVLKELKGKDFDNVIWNTGEGFSLDPLYTAEESKEAIDAFPDNRGEFNYQNSWTVLQEHSGRDLKVVNESILLGLQSGVQGLVIEAQSSLENYNIILEGVYVDWIKIGLDSKEGKEDLKKFIEYASSKEVGGNDLRGAMNFDPLNQLLLNGQWQKSKEECFENVRATVTLGSDLWKFKTINIEGALYGDKGSSIVNELAYSLALYHEYIMTLSDSVDTKVMLESIQVTLSIGRSFFLELSKVKAFRVLHAQLLSSYDLPSTEINIVSRSSAFEMSSTDEYNNLLRLTTHVMAAGVGGANDVLLKTFDGKGNKFSQRMSTNIQMLLIEESFLTKSADLSSGAYVVEKITKEISQKAWIKFKEIEANGGWLQCVENGSLQKDLLDDATEKIQKLNDGDRAWLGVNAYKNSEEKSWEDSEIVSGETNDFRTLHNVQHNIKS
ncbi:MAG: methylmalonyl-CoA mutase [Patiriisocius sp.]